MEVPVTTRHLIAYLLMLVLIAGTAFVLWIAVYNSERNVSRRRWRERRARSKAEDAEKHSD
jgi:hypothetical protein